MLNRVLPATIDNDYQGNRIALYFFYLMTAITLVRSCLHIFLNDGGAQSIATIPLDSYTPGGARAVIFIFALWGLSQLMMGLLYLLVALRYKSLVPLMYVFIFFDWCSRLAIGFYKTMETTETAPGAVGNYIFVVLVPVLFYLSIRRSSN